MGSVIDTVPHLLPTRCLALDGVQLRYHASGEGEDVLLLHGFPETLQAWAGVAPLAARYRLHAFDWMGLGGSDAPDDFDYSFEGYARLIVEVLDRLGIARAHLVATDIGMPAALLCALDAPDRVRTLTVFDGPVFERPASWSWEIHALRTPPLGEIMVHGLPRTMFWVAMHRGFYGEPCLHPDVWEDFHAQVRRPACRRVALKLFRSARPALARLEAQIGDLSMPLQILWGENDVFDRVETGFELQRACPGSVLHVAPQCGHFLAQEKPAFLLERLTAFLD